MGVKAEYKSAIRSRKLIRQAFLELLQEKEAAKITVTDIVKRADINRGTFYAHYQDVHAVMEQIENEIIDKMMEFLSALDRGNFYNDPTPLLLQVSQYLSENLDYYRVLINSRESGTFLDKLKDIFVSFMVNDAHLPAETRGTPQFVAQAYFIAGGVCNLYQAWFHGAISMSLEELARSVGAISANVPLPVSRTS